MSEPLACPFCAAPMTLTPHGKALIVLETQCEDKDCPGYHKLLSGDVYRSALDDFIKLWNTRAQPPSADCVIVPKEPTEEMIAAAYNRRMQKHAIWGAMYCDIYDAMISAAPNTQIIPRTPIHGSATLQSGAPDGQPDAVVRGTFKRGDLVRKKGNKGQWHGKIVGEYSASCTPEGYAVESLLERGSVQIYPASALEAWDGETK